MQMFRGERVYFSRLNLSSSGRPRGFDTGPTALTLTCLACRLVHVRSLRFQIRFIQSISLT